MDPVWYPLDLADCPLEPTARRGGVESSHDSPLEGNGFELAVRGRGQPDCRLFVQPASVSSRAHRQYFGLSDSTVVIRSQQHITFKLGCEILCSDLTHAANLVISGNSLSINMQVVLVFL